MPVLCSVCFLEFSIFWSLLIVSGIVPYLFYGCNFTLAGVHPRHPPRAFPLGLLAPRCLCVRYRARFLGRGSFLSPGRATLVARVRALVFRPRHPHSTLCKLEYVVSLSLLNFCEIYNHGAHPLAMDATSGNARGSDANAHLTHPPVRVCTKPRSQGQEGASGAPLIKFWLQNHQVQHA